MRSLLIQYPNDFAIIAPVRRDRLLSFELLLNHLHQQWQIECKISDHVLQVADRLAQLFPRLDRPGKFGFDVRLLPQIEFESLFLAQVINGEIAPCRLIELHSFKAEGRRLKGEGEALTPADIPIPSSGLPDADLFASLIGIDNTIEGAWRMWTQLDAEFIDKAISHLNELRRDPQERMNEYLKARFDEWKRENRTSYYKDLGIN